jgi:hypothetical protein
VPANSSVFSAVAGRFRQRLQFDRFHRTHRLHGRRGAGRIGQESHRNLLLSMAGRAQAEDRN